MASKPLYKWLTEDELSPLPAHVHQFKCECGEKCDG